MFVSFIYTLSFFLSHKFFLLFHEQLPTLNYGSARQNSRYLFYLLVISKYYIIIIFPIYLYYKQYNDRKVISDYQQRQKYQQIKSGSSKNKINSSSTSPATFIISPKQNPSTSPLATASKISTTSKKSKSPSSSPANKWVISPKPKINVSPKSKPTNPTLPRSRSRSPAKYSPNSNSGARGSFDIDDPKTNKNDNTNRRNEPIVTDISSGNDNNDMNYDNGQIKLSEDDRKDKSIVIDNGTSLLKIGYVGDKKPVAAFHPTQISNGRILKTNPIERGIVKDLYKIEDVYKHAFRNILCLNDDQLKEYGVIMNCAAFNPRQTAEDLCELMFETFGVERFFISSAAVLSLYAMQKVSGLVIESGGGLTQCVPIWKGCPVAQACKRLDVGGNDIDEYLYDLLKTKHNNLTNIDMKICRQIKEKYGYIALDYRKESAKKIDFKLPDGTLLKLGDERFKCGELLFSYLSRNSVDKQIFESIMACDVDIRKQLFSNIVISGGTMMLRGIKNRLNNELIQLCKNSKIKKTQKYAKKINILVHKNRDILSWLGGSIFGSLSAFKEMWYTRKQYQENGSLLSTRIENNNIFFYDEYQPKEVDLKEIQNYNTTYRRRTVSVYSHKNSITTIDMMQENQPTASNAYSGMSIGIKPRSSQQQQQKQKKHKETLGDIAIEPWNDNDIDEDYFNDNDDEKKSKSKSPNNKVNKNNDGNQETIRNLLSQLEELQLENENLKKENETLKEENKFHKHNEKKMETEKLKIKTERLRLENLKNELKLKSGKLVKEIEGIQQLFNNGNNRLQNLNLDLLSIDHNQTKIEPIND